MYSGPWLLPQILPHQFALGSHPCCVPHVCRWGLGVLMYVLLTGRQPFSTPKTDDPMVVMRRIVDENYQIKYPPYLSAQAKVRDVVECEWGG